MTKFIPGMRQDERFIFFSLNHLLLIKDLPSDKSRLFEVTRDFSVIKEYYDKMSQDEKPLVCELHPLLPEADNFRGTEEANLVRASFSMHVRGFPEHPQLHVSKPVNTKGGSWIDEELLRKLSYEWIEEAVRVIEERSDGKGGELPLPHTLLGTSLDTSQQATRLNIRNALTAKIETVKTPAKDMSSKKPHRKVPRDVT